MEVFLNSYNPLVRFPAGRQAIALYGLHPFVDYSCRREPDFEATYPSITALCRVDKLVPRVQPGDLVVYLTTKDRHPGSEVRHRRLVAILVVEKRFASHGEAAAWYRERGEPLPRNCMVPDNPRLAIELTAPVTAFETDLHRWDLQYYRHSRHCGIFLACRADYLELDNPPMVTDEMLGQAFGRVPGTQTPPKVRLEELQTLRGLCHI